MNKFVGLSLVDDLSLDCGSVLDREGVGSLLKGVFFRRRVSVQELEDEVSGLSDFYSQFKNQLLFIGDELYLFKGFEVQGGVIKVVLESRLTFDEYLLHWDYKSLQGMHGVNFLSNGRFRFRSLENAMNKLGFRVSEIK